MSLPLPQQLNIFIEPNHASYSKRAITNFQLSERLKSDREKSEQLNKAASYRTVVKVAQQSSVCLIRSDLSFLRTETHLQQCSREHLVQNPSLLTAHQSLGLLHHMCMCTKKTTTAAVMSVMTSKTAEAEVF